MKSTVVSIITIVTITLLGVPTLAVPQLSHLKNFEYDPRLCNGKLNYWNRDAIAPADLANMVSPYINKPTTGLNNLGVSQDMTEQTEQQKSGAPYKFIFQSKDQTRYEVSDDKGNVKGTFTFVDKQYGVPKTVNYEAGVAGVSNPVNESPSFNGNGTPQPPSPADQFLSSRKEEIEQWSRQIASLPARQIGKLPVNLGQYQPSTASMQFNPEFQSQQRVDQSMNPSQSPYNGALTQNMLEPTNMIFQRNTNSQFLPGKPTVVLLPPIPVLPLLPKGTPECRNQAGEFVVNERCIQAGQIPPMSPQLANLVSQDRSNGQIPFFGSNSPLSRFQAPVQQFGTPSMLPSAPVRQSFDKFPFGSFESTNMNSLFSTNTGGNMLPNDERASYSVLSPDGMMRIVGFSELPTGNGAAQTLISNSLSDVSSTIESSPSANPARIVSPNQMASFANTFNPGGSVGFPMMFISPAQRVLGQSNPQEKNKEIVVNSAESKDNGVGSSLEDDSKKETTSVELQSPDKTPDSDYEVLAAIAEKIAKLAKARNPDGSSDSVNEISK